MGTSIIYLAQCKIDSSQLYVGKTDRTLEERQKEHERSAMTGRPTPFHQALIAEGFKHWEWRVLEECPAEKVSERERFWIGKLGALSVDLLNVSHTSEKPSGTIRQHNRLASKLGGINVWKNPSAREWLFRSGKLRPVINLTSSVKYSSLTEAAQKEKDQRPGIKKSCDTGRPTISGNRYAWLDVDGNPALTDGHRKELPRTRRVKNLSTQKTFESIKEAAIVHSLRPQLIQSVCTGKYQSCKGMSFCYIDDDGNEQLTESHRKYVVKQERGNVAFAAYIFEDTKFERPIIFDTVKKLSENLGLSKSHILAVCKGQRQHVQGYRVAYFDKSSNQPTLTDAHKLPIKKILRKVMCLDDNHQVFKTPSAAARNYGLDSQQISLCCKGRLKSTGYGKTRRRFAYVDDNGKPILTPKHKEPLVTKGKRVFCPQLRREFQSVAEFCRETGVPAKRVKKYLLDPLVDLGGLELVEF
jgi:hypothetical protein